MPAASMCRARCSRLAPSLAWSRRPTLLALWQNYTAIRRIAAIATETEHQTLSSLPSYDRTTSSSQLNRQDDSQQQSQIPTGDTPERPRPLLGGIMAKALWPKEMKQENPSVEDCDYEHHNERRHKPRLRAHLRQSKGRQFHHPQSRHETTHTQALEQQRKAAIKEHSIQGRAMQWGYLRHQFPEGEMQVQRGRFNKWVKRFLKVENQDTSRRWAWQDDGKWLFELDSVPAMREAWEKLDVESRKRQWSTVMLSTLHTCPEKAVHVLEATLDPIVPGYAIHDALRVIVKRLPVFQRSTSREQEAKALEVLELFTKVIEDLPAGHVPFKQATLGAFFRKLPVDHVLEFYQMLQRSGIHLHRHTLLHVASPLATRPSTKAKAFEILRDIADQGANLNQSHYSSVITTLLHPTHMAEAWAKSEDDIFSPQQALQYFIEKGFSPNVINFTSLLESLCKQGDVAEAVRLPLLLAETGVALDPRCYEAVYRGAKNSLKAEHIKGAFDVAKAANAPYVDVLNNALHTIFYFAEMESREKKYPAPWVTPLFIRMLRIYAKKFDLEPLQWLLPDTLPLELAQENPDGTEKFRAGPKRQWDFRDTILPVVDEFFSGGPTRRLQPNTTTLAIMLRAYIRSLHRPYDLLSFYSFFKSRLEERGEDNGAVKLVKEQGSIIHDSLILVMTDQDVLLRPALQVFGDMLRDSMKPKDASSTPTPDAPPDASPVHPPPSFFTFSILTHGLIMRGETMLAEQVLGVMREHDIEPNLVTWNTLVKGYAAMQNIPRTVGALQDLEAAGYKPDVHTFRAFSRLRDQTRALEAMERIIDANKRRMEKDREVD